MYDDLHICDECGVDLAEYNHLPGCSVDEAEYQDAYGSSPDLG